MKKKLLTLFLGLCGSALTLVGAQNANTKSSTSNSFNIDGWYLGASGSVGFHSNQKSKSTPTGAAREISFKTGGGGAVAVGLMFMENFRFELEGSYRTNSVKKASTPTTGKANASGSVEYTSLMVNAAYDIPAFENVIISLGGGLGWTYAKMGNVNRAGVRLLNSRGDNVLGWQLMAQIGYMFQEQFTLYVGYRLFSTTQPRYRNPAGGQLKMESPYLHNIDFGVRIHL